MNTYGYVGGNPLNWIDTIGLMGYPYNPNLPHWGNGSVIGSGGVTFKIHILVAGVSIGYAYNAGTDGEVVKSVTVCVNVGPGAYVGLLGDLKLTVSSQGTSDSVYGDSISFNGDVGFKGSVGYDVSIGLDSDSHVPNSATDSFNPNPKGAGGVGYGAQASIGYCHTFDPSTSPPKTDCDKNKK